MQPKHVKVCCGNKCSQRGGGEPLLTHLQNTLNTNQDQDKTAMEACGCLGNCERGPSVVADGKLYSEAKIHDIAERIKSGSGVSLSEIDIDSILREDGLF